MIDAPIFTSLAARHLTPIALDASRSYLITQV